MQTDIAAEVRRAIRDALAEASPSEKRLWSVRSWAKVHDMSVVYVYGLIKSGRLRAAQLGDRMMITDDAGREFLSTLPEPRAVA